MTPTRLNSTVGVDDNRQLLPTVESRRRRMWEVATIGCLNTIQQTSTCILNTFAEVCWTFAGSYKHPVRYRKADVTRQSNVVWQSLTFSCVNQFLALMFSTMLEWNEVLHSVKKIPHQYFRRSNRVLINFFKTNSRELVIECQRYFGFPDVVELIRRKKRVFLTAFSANKNIACNVFKHADNRELHSLRLSTWYWPACGLNVFVSYLSLYC